MNRSRAKLLWFDTPRKCAIETRAVAVCGTAMNVNGSYFGLPVNVALAHPKIVRLVRNSIINRTIRSRVFRRRMDKIKNFHGILGELKIEWNV